MSPRLSTATSGIGHADHNNNDHQEKIWNQFTYSAEHFRLHTRMKMVEKRSALLGTKSEYLKRMQKSQVAKLQIDCNDEKSRVKVKR